MKVVLDTNIFLSGLMLPRSLPGKILRAWLGARFDFVVSEAILEEITRVLSYPKIQKRLEWNEKEILDFIKLI